MKKIFFPVLFFCFILTSCSGKKIDLLEYADIVVTGFNEKGRADVDVDWGSFEDGIFKASEKDALSTISDIFELENSIEYSVDKKENLSNGDKVTLTVKWDKEIAKKHKLSFTADKKTVTVKDLEELKEIDVFSDIHIDYEGVSPFANASVRNASNDSFIKGLRFSIDNYRNLSIGDKITVRADITPEEAEREGYLLTESEKVFTVENADYYISSYNEIGRDALDKMESQAEDLIDSTLANKNSVFNTLYPDKSISFIRNPDTVRINKITLVNSYFFKLKQGLEIGYSDVGNSIFLVYEVKFTSEFSTDGEETVYLPVYFSNLIMRDSGDVDVVVTNAVIATAKSSSFENMYRDVVTVNKAKYDYEEIEY